MTLNPQQQAAVESRAALKVVIAGPGSGKTRTLVEAMAKSKGRVAVMTFTNAGANELRSRWLKYENCDMKLVHCGTLHSYCFKLIQRFGGFLGYIPGKVGILPDAERIPRLLACRDKLGVNMSQKALLDRLHTTGSEWTKQQLVWREYEFLLKRNNLVDYDGILRVALDLLSQPERRAQVKLDYLFVDEYQDSALIDQQIYGAIFASNFMIVGDPDQSIFAFRGAYPAGMVALATGLASHQPELHKLELNYRSDSDICDAANDLIACNKERVEKVIRPTSGQRGCVEVNGFEDVGQELVYLAGRISGRNLGSATLGESESIAVLYRMNHDVKQCRDYLAAMGIPVQVPKFEQRPADWERAMLLIGLAIAPTEILIERLLKLYLGAAEVERMKLVSTANGGQFIDCAKLKIPTDWFLAERRIRDAYLYLSMNGVSEATIRLIQERVQLLPENADLSDLLHDLHTAEEPKASNEAEGVYVGTIHSAKGREWDVVFLPAFEQGILPHCKTREFYQHGPGASQLDKEPPELEEERRLAFVAVTRARHELYISHCAHRRGPWGPVGLGQPSQFIKEMGL